jgi:type II secretory pathway pseudopilin PulG
MVWGVQERERALKKKLEKDRKKAAKKADEAKQAEEETAEAKKAARAVEAQQRMDARKSKSKKLKKKGSDSDAPPNKAPPTNTAAAAELESDPGAMRSFDDGGSLFRALDGGSRGSSSAAAAAAEAAAADALDMEALEELAGARKPEGLLRVCADAAPLGLVCLGLIFSQARALES